jgi:nucleotide-binding universal stress UspA family protein
MGPVAPGRPRAVLVSGAQPADVRAGLTKLLGAEALPPIEPVDPIDQAEDIFDSLVGQLAGRRQPSELATPDDWRVLIAAAAEYARAQPWRHWSDEDALRVVIGVDGVSAPCVALVLGASGVQRGLNLVPGMAVPPRMDRWRPGQPLPMPPGSLLLWLDPAAETGSAFLSKARRYGWPADLDVFPTWFTVEKGDPADLGRNEARRLTVALIAVASRHADVAAMRQPRWSGTTTLADGAHAKYTFRD